MEITKEEFEEIISEKAVLSTLIRILNEEQEKCIKNRLDNQDTYIRLKPFIDKLIKEEASMRQEREERILKCLLDVRSK